MMIPTPRALARLTLAVSVLALIGVTAARPPATTEALPRLLFLPLLPLLQDVGNIRKSF